MNKKAIIFGVKGFALTLKEKNLFKKSYHEIKEK